MRDIWVTVGMIDHIEPDGLLTHVPDLSGIDGTIISWSCIGHDGSEMLLSVRVELD